MNRTLYTLVLSALLSLSTTSTFSAEEESTDKRQTNNFVAPKLIKRTPPNYPSYELNHANAGAVEITFMIDKNGKTFEPIVDYSSKPSFEPLAILALKSYRYKPATFNGEPVDSVKSIA